MVGCLRLTVLDKPSSYRPDKNPMMLGLLVGNFGDRLLGPFFFGRNQID
jgi:hypothetical protein